MDEDGSILTSNQMKINKARKMSYIGAIADLSQESFATRTSKYNTNTNTSGGQADLLLPDIYRSPRHSIMPNANQINFG